MSHSVAFADFEGLEAIMSVQTIREIAGIAESLNSGNMSEIYAALATNIAGSAATNIAEAVESLGKETALQFIPIARSNIRAQREAARIAHEQAMHELELEHRRAMLELERREREAQVILQEDAVAHTKLKAAARRARRDAKRAEKPEPQPAPQPEQQAEKQ